MAEPGTSGRKQANIVSTPRAPASWWGSCFVALVLAAGCGRAAAGGETAKAAESPARGFSFVVYGDSRSMMVLPDRADQEAQARKMMVDMFALAVPEKVARHMAKRLVKLTYDPDTGELAGMVMPFMTASEVTRLTFDKGWVTQASVEDVRLLPGVHRTIYRFGRRRVGRPRGGQRSPTRTSPVRASYRGPGVVGPAGRICFRESLLDAGARRCAESAAAADCRDANRRVAWAHVPRRRKSRGLV